VDKLRLRFTEQHVAQLGWTARGLLVALQHNQVHRTAAFSREYLFNFDVRAIMGGVAGSLRERLISLTYLELPWFYT
jgi:hypothetical protein